MIESWRMGTGVLELPSGRRIRGRSRRRPPEDGPRPTVTVLLAAWRPAPSPGESHWLCWPDFWLPTRPAAARRLLRQLHERAPAERVEIACAGGVGRTGTALAALAAIDGLGAADAVDWVRARYHPRALEVPWQRTFVRFCEPHAG